MAEIIVPIPRDLLLTNLDLDTPAQVNRSKWTGRRKGIGLPGAEVWYGTAAIADIASEEEERPWRAFLFGFSGPADWFRWPLPCNSHIGPKPTVAAGAGGGNALPLTGMQPNATILRAGQFMTVPLPSGHSRAVCLTAPLIVDADGDATATFRPALNEAPVEGATVETAKPFIPMSPAEFRLGFSLTDAISGTSFTVEEAM